MLKIMKSGQTAKISAADDVRDKAIAATLRILSAFELSDNETELQAYLSLHRICLTPTRASKNGTLRKKTAA